MPLSPWMDLERDYSGRYSLSQLRRQMDDFVRELERPFWIFGGGAMADVSIPATNLYDNGNELVLCAAIPGLTEKDLDITCAGNVLTMSGERKLDAPEGYTVHRQERTAMRFARSVTLPTKIDMDKIDATVKDGLLTIRMTKAAEAQPRRISVHTT